MEAFTVVFFIYIQLSCLSSNSMYCILEKNGWLPNVKLFFTVKETIHR